MSDYSMQVERLPNASVYEERLRPQVEPIFYARGEERLRRGVESFRQQVINQNLSSAAGQAAAGATRLTGQFLLMGAGEKRVPVDFPVPFSDKPLLTFGGELQEGAAIIPGQFPTVSAVVGRWFTRENPPFSRLYLGAELLVVTTGAPTQQLLIHWNFDGTALTNPI